MNATVTGKFSAVKQASRAIDKLLECCLSDDCVRTIVLKPSVQIAAENRDKSSHITNNHGATAEHPLARGGVLDKIGDDERRKSSRPAGILVAVETPNRVSRALAVSVLREHGALIVESDEGSPPGKRWADADPISLSALLDEFDAERKQRPGFVPIEIERPSSRNAVRRAG